jgi:hypothetical protein
MVMERVRGFEPPVAGRVAAELAEAVALLPA